MIKINLTDKQILEAQSKHWAWFKKYNKLNTSDDKLLQKINENNVPLIVKKLLQYFKDNEESLKNLIIGKPDVLRSEIKTIIIKFDKLFGISHRKMKISKLETFRNNLPNITSVNKNNKQESLNKIVLAIEELNFVNFYNKSLTGGVGQIQDIIRDLQKKRDHFIQFLAKKKISDEIKKDFFNHLSDVFSYDEFKKKDSNWNAYEWVKYLDLKVCPYCNRQFIHYYWDENDVKKMRPALDHFYPKGLYPFLGVSLFNLVPSCYTCNSSFKGEIDFFLKKHMNPFEEDFGKDGKFRTDFKLLENGTHDITYLTSVKTTDDFKLDLKIKTDDTGLESKINNSNDTFKINGLYQNHKDYAHEIIKKTHMYNKSRLEDLMNSFGGDLFDSKEELMQTIMGNYLTQEKQGDRVLAKLTQDIFDEFKIEEIWDEAVK